MSGTLYLQGHTKKNRRSRRDARMEEHNVMTIAYLQEKKVSKQSNIAFQMLP